MNKIMKRIYANTAFLPYKDILTVYNQLSNEDQLLISPNGKFINSPYLASRNIKYIKDKPIGFAEAYQYNGKSATTVFIIVAVLEDYRNLGIGSELIRDICNDCFNQGYTRIIYKCNKNNHNSAALAEKNGFQLIKQMADELTYELTNVTSQIVHTQPSYKLYPLPKYNYYPYQGYYPTYYHNGYLNNYLDNQDNSDSQDYSDYPDSYSDNYTSDISSGDVSFDGGGGDSGGGE